MAEDKYDFVRQQMNMMYTVDNKLHLTHVMYCKELFPLQIIVQRTNMPVEKFTKYLLKLVPLYEGITLNFVHLLLFETQSVLQI
jgi:hypothetical protein